MSTRVFRFRYWFAVSLVAICTLVLTTYCASEPPASGLPNVHIEARVPELSPFDPPLHASEKSVADPSTIKSVDTLLYHPDLETRLNAISNLGDEAHAEAASLLRALLDDALPAVREEAVEALSVLGGAESVAGLAYAMSDESITVRRLAIEGLASMQSDEATNALALALNDTDPSLRELAIDGLADIGTENALAVLQSFLSDPNDGVAELAGEYVMR